MVTRQGRFLQSRDFIYRQGSSGVGISAVAFSPTDPSVMYLGLEADEVE
ncbi:hypothetical protein [Polyangium aurulentum]|nr:hypothetical protein [Polyangium aurulentum]UQA60609.1 hypothetical protein E8A73_009100 [Polyangium aurulentum]